MTTVKKPEIGDRVKCVIPGFEDGTPGGVVTGYGLSSPVYGTDTPDGEMLRAIFGGPEVKSHPGGNPGVSIRWDDGKDDPEDFYAYDGDLIEVAVVEDEA